MTSSEPRCDIGGDYHYPRLDGPAVYRQPCTAPPTHRYRSPGMVDGHWQHRCDPHAAWLDRSICTVETLTDQEGTASRG